MQCKYYFDFRYRDVLGLVVQSRIEEIQNQRPEQLIQFYFVVFLHFKIWLIPKN